MSMVAIQTDHDTLVLQRNLFTCVTTAGSMLDQSLCSKDIPLVENESVTIIFAIAGLRWPASAAKDSRQCARRT